MVPSFLIPSLLAQTEGTTEQTAPVFPIVVALLCVALVLTILCKPSRKS